MALESKTFLNDTGSAVIKEIATQLNTASAFSTPALAVVLEGSGTLGDRLIATTGSGAGCFFVAAEECIVTSIRMLTLTTQLNASAPDDTEFIVLKVPANYTNQTAAEDRLVPPTTGIHGNNDTVLGNASSGYQVIIATDGNTFSDANNFDVGQWGELLGLTATGGATAIPADAFNSTFIAQDHAATPAVNGLASIHMGTGDSLVWGLQNTAGGNVSLLFSVGYRPVKDEVLLTPNFTQKPLRTRSR